MAGGEKETFGVLAQPGHQLIQVLGRVMGNQKRKSQPHFSRHLTKALGSVDYAATKFAKANAESDRLFKATYYHSSQRNDCSGCPASEEIVRP